MRYLFILFLFVSSICSANSTWTDFREIGVVYTYTKKDSMYVYLKGVTCPNTKNYFTVDGTVQENASQLVSMILAARMAKVPVNIHYNPAESSEFCYVKGLQLQE